MHFFGFRYHERSPTNELRARRNYAPSVICTWSNSQTETVMHHALVKDRQHHSKGCAGEHCSCPLHELFLWHGDP